jgi:uncharacterized protein YfkK (UPF0435 family)
MFFLKMCLDDLDDIYNMIDRNESLPPELNVSLDDFSEALRKYIFKELE